MLRRFLEQYDEYEDEYDDALDEYQSFIVDESSPTEAEAAQIIREKGMWHVVEVNNILVFINRS